MASRLPSAVLALLAVALSKDIGQGQGQGRNRRSDDQQPLEPVVSALSQKVDQLTAQNAAMATQLSQLNQRLQVAETAVAFSVRFIHSDISNLGKEQTLKFDNVLYNAGNGYSKETGFFTAPSSDCSAQWDDGSCTQLNLMHGTLWLVTADACNHYLNTGSNMVVRHLNAGDNVHVQIYSGNRLHGDFHTTFSGMKLSPN